MNSQPKIKITQEIQTFSNKKTNEEVLFSKCNNYEDSIKLIKKMLIKSEFFKKLKKEDKILIKPNLLIPKSVKTNVTTNHNIIEGIIIALIEKIPKENIFLGDSPAFGTTKTVTKFNGIFNVCKKYNISLIDFKNEILINLKTFKKVPIFNNYEDYKIINVPKIKTHTLTNFTCAIKNLYGLIPGSNKTAYHVKLPDEKNFSKLLYEFAKEVNTSFTIVDGILGMDKNGPNAGKERKIGIIVMGNNNFTMDFICSKAVDIDYKKITYLKYSKKLEENDKTIDFKFIEKIQKSLNLPIIKFRLPEHKKSSIINSYLKSKLIKRIFKSFGPRPKINPKLCINCNRCINQCPVNALLKNTTQPVFDYSKCIRCYCCQEVCPQNAINIKKGLI